MKAILFTEILAILLSKPQNLLLSSIQRREFLPYQIVKRYVDSIYKGFQIRNDFFRGNIGRTLEFKRTHFREMTQIYTTWEEPCGTNSIKLVCSRGSMLPHVATQQDSKAREKCQNVVSGALFKKCSYTETLIKSYSLIFSFLSLCGNKKHVWTKPLFLYISTVWVFTDTLLLEIIFLLWMNTTPLIGNLFISSVKPTGEGPYLMSGELHPPYWYILQEQEGKIWTRFSQNLSPPLI